MGRRRKIRLTGIDTPLGGASVEYVETERELIRQLFLFLEDRYILSTAVSAREAPPDWNHRLAHSAQKITAEVTRVLRKLPEDSRAVRPLIRMRSHLAAQTHGTGKTNLTQGLEMYWLGYTRAQVGAQVAVLAEMYDLHVREPLRSWLPLADK